MDTADGSRRISDILETGIARSLTEPSLTTGWKRVTATADADATAAGFQFTTEAVAGTMYYVGHNENFGNYRSTDPDFVTGPATPRLRIGLAHSGNETDDQRDDVDFEACRIRITDADGDALTEAYDVATVPSCYGAADWEHDNDGGTPAKGTRTAGYALVNVRISDDGTITEPMHPAPRSPIGTAPWNPTTSPWPW